jgi:NAD(P)H-flavin reductase
MVPDRFRVVDRRGETADTVTLVVAPVDDPRPPPRPGQFHMLYAVGVGEVPISVSAIGPGDRPDQLAFTIRAVGAVTRSLAGLPVGAIVGGRGPFGRGWSPELARGADVLVVAGGLGLAPLRPVLHEVVANRDDYGAVALVVGARRPSEVLFADEIAEWSRYDIHVEVTVDAADRTWTGPVGVVTTRLSRAPVTPTRTTAFVCGPEVMMRFTARDLVDRGIPPEQVRLSVERNMRCAIGHCGHCQLGPHLLCRTGPVLTFPEVQRLLEVWEL